MYLHHNGRDQEKEEKFHAHIMFATSHKQTSKSICIGQKEENFVPVLTYVGVVGVGFFTVVGGAKTICGKG